jgi:hypothetical protein
MEVRPVGIVLLHADGVTDRQTGKADRQRDRRDEAKSRFSQLRELAQQETRDPGIRTAIPVVELLQTYASDRTPTGIGH